MGKFMRTRKGIGEVAVMEVSHSHVGVKTRARSLAIAQAKRRKSSSPESTTPENSVSDLNSGNSAPVTESVSCSTPNSDQIVGSERVNESVSDLEDTHEEFENSPYRESMRELHSESSELESTERQSEAVAEVEAEAAKKPTSQEIEDFFAKLEKDETKKFADKYNFDFVNETPLEGRFEWIPLKP